MQQNQKLNRSKDSKILGGVCAGLGKYFGIDPIWIRLLYIFITITILFGIPIYFILWALLPEEKEKNKTKEAANNTSETKMTNDGATINEFAENSNLNQLKTEIKKLLGTLAKLLNTTSNLIGKILGVFIVLISSIVLLVILTIIFAGSGAIGLTDNFMDISSFLDSSFIMPWFWTVCIFTLFGFPFILLLLVGIKIVYSKVKTSNVLVFLAILFTGIILLKGYLTKDMEDGLEVAIQGIKTDEESFTYNPQQTLEVAMVKNQFFVGKATLLKNNIQRIINDAGVQKQYCNNITVDVIYNDTDAATVKISRYSEGVNRNIADKNAAKIEYNYTIDNGKIILDGYFLSPITASSKVENVSVIISMPSKTVIYLTASTNSFLDEIETIQDVYSSDMPNHHFRMTPVGLECTDCDEDLFRN